MNIPRELCYCNQRNDMSLKSIHFRSDDKVINDIFKKLAAEIKARKEKNV